MLSFIVDHLNQDVVVVLHGCQLNNFEKTIHFYHLHPMLNGWPQPMFGWQSELFFSLHFHYTTKKSCMLKLTWPSTLMRTLLSIDWFYARDLSRTLFSQLSTVPGACSSISFPFFEIILNIHLQTYDLFGFRQQERAPNQNKQVVDSFFLHKI